MTENDTISAQKQRKDLEWIFLEEKIVWNNWEGCGEKESVHSLRVVVAAAPFVKRGSRTRDVGGCQIDLLLQTNLALCLVEVKRQERIGREVVDEMRQKVRRLPHPPNISVRTALVYDGEIDPSIEADGYFDALVPSRALLGL